MENIVNKWYCTKVHISWIDTEFEEVDEEE